MIEIIAGRLYFECDDENFDEDDADCFYFTTDDNEDYHYEKFYNDFGPYNVAVLYKFCTSLRKTLKSLPLLKKRIVYYTSPKDAEKRCNSAYLLGCFAILYLNKSSHDLSKLFSSSIRTPFLPFRDAAPGDSCYSLILDDVFRAVQKANKLNWIDFDNFDLEEYEFFERVENGDLNWIIPQKIIAFCGPHLKATAEDGYPRHSPETYFEYFNTHHVTNVVRLNRKVYESSRFTRAGFRHDDLFFVDGSTPSNAIILKFIKLVEDAPGAVAVHCKAGLGRTGTLIACYMMKHYGFTASECMAWIRICRPGSIIGPQQQFLIHVQNWCRSLPGSTYGDFSPSGFSRSYAAPIATLSQVIVDDNVQISDKKSTQVNDDRIDFVRTVVSENQQPSGVGSTALGCRMQDDRATVASSMSKDKCMTTTTKVRSYNQGENLMRIKGNRFRNNSTVLKTVASAAAIPSSQRHSQPMARQTSGRSLATTQPSSRQPSKKDTLPSAALKPSDKSSPPHNASAIRMVCTSYSKLSTQASSTALKRRGDRASPPNKSSNNSASSSSSYKRGGAPIVDQTSRKIIVVVQSGAEKLPGNKYRGKTVDTGTGSRLNKSTSSYHLRNLASRNCFVPPAVQQQQVRKNVKPERACLVPNRINPLHDNCNVRRSGTNFSK